MQIPPVGEISIQVGRGITCSHTSKCDVGILSDSHKRAEIWQGRLSGFISWILPCYESPKYIVSGGISGIDAVKDQSDRG